MIKFLVGSKGFVGSNLAKQIDFDGLFDRDNVQEAYGKSPDLLIYAGVTGNKTMANQQPQQDFEIIESAIKNIELIKPKKLVLISTVDVFENTFNKDENSLPNAEFPYGKNRRFLEKWVENNHKDFHIVRLPAIYGSNLKKNLVYDLINPVPAFLSEALYAKFDDRIIKDNYLLNESGFYECKKTDGIEKKRLENYFKSKNFSTVNFTDSRAQFQFFNLDNIYEIIKVVIENNIKIFNVVTEPITAKELVENITGNQFVNYINQNYQNYNLKTKYSNLFGNENGYIENAKTQLKKLKAFILKEKHCE